MKKSPYWVIWVVLLAFAGFANAVPQKIAGGQMHTIFVDGMQVYGMGNTQYGVLGDQVPAGKNMVPVDLGISNVKAVAAARYLSLFLLDDGTALYVGFNWNRKQIINIPELIPGSEITDIAAGFSRIVYVSNGHVFEWDMVLGSTPVDKGLVDIVEVSAGYEYFMAKDVNGNTFSWGDGQANGELGNGSFELNATPLQIGMDVAAIGAGHDTAAFVHNDGRGKAWGNGANGKVGDGTVATYPMPMDIYGSHSFVQIAPGYYATGGIDVGGNLYVWGLHDYIDETDNMPFGSSTVPALVEGLTDVREVEVAYGHIIVLTNSGDIYTWGSDAYGQLGDVNNIMLNTNSPQFVATVSIVGSVIAPVVDDPVVDDGNDDRNRGHGNSNGCDADNPGKSCENYLAARNGKKSKK